jgi:peptidoglycan-N-acetylglucosamine deacetylase
MLLDALRGAAERLEHVPPGFVKKVFNGCVWQGSPDSGILALTFDDGPDPEVTPEVLDALDRVEAKGTFFLVGSKALEYPALVEEIVSRGHTVGNHTMNHRKLILSGKTVTENEIGDAQAVITGICGKAPALFRPPHGIFDFTTVKIAAEYGLKTVIWTVLSGDYRTKGPDEVMHNVEEFIKPGSIIVFHDTKEGGGMMLPGIIERIAETAAFMELELAGVDDMLGTDIADEDEYNGEGEETEYESD